MRRHLLKAISFFTVLLLLCACGENDGSSGKGSMTPLNQLNSDVVVLSEQAISHIARPVTGQELVFDGGMDEKDMPVVGTIIQVPVITEKTPFGFLGRVTGISKNGDNITVTTETVALDEAYPNLSIDTAVNILDNIEGVYDEDGKPIEYEIIHEKESKQQSRAGGKVEITDDKLGKIRIPIKNETLGDFSVGGYLSFNLGLLPISLDNKKGFKYLHIEAEPSIEANVQLGATLKNKTVEKSTKSIRVTSRVVIPPGIIIPITVYGNLVVGAKGEISTATTLQFQKSSHCFVHYENDQWTKEIKPVGKFDGEPWAVTQFDVDGELYGGVKCGLIFGLYSATTGVGFNLLPKLSLSAKAKLSSLQPFSLNPEISFGGELESSVYCLAEVFGKRLAKWEVAFPSVSFYKRSMSLFPNIENFSAVGGSGSAEISYQDKSYYFGEMLGMKTGVTVYNPDKSSVFKSYYPSYTSIDKDGSRSYNVEATGLRAGSTYYAAPTVRWPLVNKVWDGEKQAFETEGSYNLGFRCAIQTYDVVNFNFYLNNTTGNVLDYTTEAVDYNGSPMRVRVTAKYNASTKTLEGLFDTYFYDDPGQLRQDGFSLVLGDDSGYIGCSKIIDNGGCTAVLRIYKNSNSRAARKRYTRALVEDDCNVGFYNKDFRK